MRNVTNTVLKFCALSECPIDYYSFTFTDIMLLSIYNEVDCVCRCDLEQSAQLANYGIYSHRNTEADCNADITLIYCSVKY
jgi:hypothetical protein